MFLLNVSFFSFSSGRLANLWTLNLKHLDMFKITRWPFTMKFQGIEICSKKKTWDIMEFYIDWKNVEYAWILNKNHGKF